MVSMLITKPKLSLEGQIEHLKEKGVLFKGNLAEILTDMDFVKIQSGFVEIDY